MTRSSATIRDQIRRILLQYDPIHIGYTSDEYDPELDRILGGLEMVTSEDEVAPLVRSIFVEMFDDETAGPISKYSSIGREIWMAYRS
jgi:hypothetical protein